MIRLEDSISSQIICSKCAKTFTSLVKNYQIDETLIAFKGRHHLKQYMPMKPAKWGFKAFLVYESATGFCMNLKFYNRVNKEEFLPYNLTLSLLKDFERKNFHVYADNWYTSIVLVKKLQELEIKFTGTIKKNSTGMPDKNIIKHRIRNDKPII